MTQLEQYEIRSALWTLNIHYGRGELGVIDFHDMTFEQHPHGMKPEKRKFRHKNETVYALGHQIRIYPGTE